MTDMQARKMVELQISGEEIYVGKDLLVRPFLSRKAYLIGPRGRVRYVWYESPISAKVIRYQ